MSYDRKRALIINQSESRCGACRMPAVASEEAHETRPGYRPGKGCGQRWEFVTSDYGDNGGLHDRVREMRPDLIAHFA